MEPRTAAIRPEAPLHPRQETAHLVGEGDVQRGRAGSGKGRIPELHVEEVREGSIPEDAYTDRDIAVRARPDPDLPPARRQPAREVGDREQAVSRMHADEGTLVRKVGR